MANSLATKVGATECRSYIKAMDGIIERLRIRQTALFIDEADFIASKTSLLDVIRVIHDQAEVPMLLIGMTGIYPKLASQKLFVDRIQHFLELTNSGIQDTRLIADKRCAARIKADLLEYIQEETKGNARRIKRVLAHIEQFALSNDLNEVGLEEWGNKSLLPANSNAPTKQKRSA